MTSPKLVRCAIYSRVSDDQGLEQDFNSLDAQYDASQSYIRSQAHADWTLIPSKYADGGFTGGDIDRPALQLLLDDVRSGKVDVIVVYKVDRLTHAAVQHHHVNGAAHPQYPSLVRPVRTRGHFRAHPRQDHGLQAQGPMGRRDGTARLRCQGSQDLGQRRRGRAGPDHFPSLP